MPAPKGNQYAIGNKGGRPPVFKNHRALAKKVDQYFVFIQGEFHLENQKVWDSRAKKYKSELVKVWDRRPEDATITGLTIYLGFASRQSLDDYAERNDEFSDVIARARTRVEYEYEKKLSQRDTQGVIFVLKNMGWKDKHEIESTNKNLNLNVPLTPEKVRELEELKKKEF